MKSLAAALLVLVAMSRARAPGPAQNPAPVPAATVPAPLPPTLRQRLLVTASAEIGTQEKSGKNDGPAVDKYLQAAGLAPNSRQPYCAAFVYWAGKTALGAKNPFPQSAWSPDMVAGGTADIASAKPGDTFGIYFASKGRVAHTGIVRGWQKNYLVTIEANTSPTASTGEADRNGDGVWSKLRDKRTIHRIKSWLP